MDNKIGSGDKWLDASVIIAALICFIKTADVFAYFAPAVLSQILGFDVSYLFGVITATLVEGVMLRLHFNRRAHGYTPAEIAKWLLMAISLLCQVFDGFIVTNTLAQQSDEMKFLFQYGVPALPILLIVLNFAIGKLPDTGEQVTHVGLKHRLPNWKRIWEGDEAKNEPQEKSPEKEPAKLSYNKREER